MKKILLVVGILILFLPGFILGDINENFPVLKGPYLGQKPPGRTPEVFAPGIVSTKADEYAFEISLSGKEMLFMRKNRIMLVTRNKEGVWNKPAVAPFSGKFIDDEPCFYPDGQAIYFMSRRPAPDSKYPSNLWMVKKQNGNWNKPYRLKNLSPVKLLHAPSVAGNGNIYEDGIIRYKYVRGTYLMAEKITSLRGMYPFVSPEESYIIFSARLPGKRDADLFISFYGHDKIWSKGISLGNEINSSAHEGNSFVTADGKYLFFGRKRDIYWVDAKIIESLRQKQPAAEK